VGLNINNIWFTADTHWGHRNIIQFCNRPFENVMEMDSILIENWNKKIKPDDIVYHLGDFSMGNIKRYRLQLNGKIILIYGSHDKEALKHPYLFEEICPLKTIRIDENYIVLCHYAMRVWDHSHYGAYMAYGHSHGRLPSYGKSMDVGVDCHNYFPISYDEFVLKIKKLENNHDLVSKEERLICHAN
jgi:calcineurin-like phosphoesterase family protein